MLHTSRQRDFNPRAREGRDVDIYDTILSVFDFNPRAREGRDMNMIAEGLLGADFNPRAREGRDSDLSGYQPSLSQISIHAPVKGATT